MSVVPERVRTKSRVKHEVAK